MHGGGEAVREDAALGEVLGAFGQRAVEGVVPAEASEASGGRPLAAKSGVSVTMPAGGCSPAATAAHPATAVVATDPRAPISQTP
ncbi:hypothetical protein STENM223S_08252 [Streptomyces tendae]